MGHQAIIYGRIQELWEGTQSGWPVTPEYNNGVLESLPDEDDCWPFLTRHMFAVAPRAYRGNSDRGEYRGRVIHLAASLKDSADGKDWPRLFLEKMENKVLGKLLWTSAKVHFESAFFPERVFVYQSHGDSIAGLREELKSRLFGERIDAMVSWDCQETTLLRNEAPWLR